MISRPIYPWGTGRPRDKRSRRSAFPPRKKHMKAQPLEAHEAKWLARLSTPTATIKVVQSLMGTDDNRKKMCRAYLKVSSKSAKRGRRLKSKIIFIAKRPLPFNAKLFRALDALVTEGKIQTTIMYTEWNVQVALGTATTRTFYK